MLEKMSSATFQKSLIEIGAIVRAPRRIRIRRSKSKSVDIHECTRREVLLCRSMVCTISDDGKYADVLWERESGDSSSYLVAPKLEAATKVTAATVNTSHAAEEVEDAYEDSIPVDQIQPLLPFEHRSGEATTDWHNKDDDKVNASYISASSKDKLKKNIQRILLEKQQGDDLLILRDPYAAIEQYEQALFHSSNVEVGGTVILNRKGYPTLAHVDCIDGYHLHVTILNYSSSRSNPSQEVLVEEEEIEISSSKVLLALLVLPSNIHDKLTTKDDALYIHLQERILLNLARCFLMIVQAEDGEVEGRKSDRMTKYLQASVLACTLALSCLTANIYYGDNTTTPIGTATTTTTALDLERKARFLRATTYLQLHKLHHAMTDVQYILSKETKVTSKLAIPSSSFERLKKEIHNQIVQKKQLNKQLTKDMCQWLQEATKNM